MSNRDTLVVCNPLYAQYSLRILIMIGFGTGVTLVFATFIWYQPISNGEKFSARFG